MKKLEAVKLWWVKRDVWQKASIVLLSYLAVLAVGGLLCNPAINEKDKEISRLRQALVESNQSLEKTQAAMKDQEREWKDFHSRQMEQANSRSEELRTKLDLVEGALRVEYHLIRGSKDRARFYAFRFADRLLGEWGVGQTELNLPQEFLELLPPYYMYERHKKKGEWVGSMITIRRVENP